MTRKYFEGLILDVAKYNKGQLINCREGGVLSAGGVNGPYFDMESPVRNTAHWCITYSVLAKKYPEELFGEVANQLSNFLINSGKFQKNGVYVHRQKHGKDWCNGVIGQGWVIEALAIAASHLGRKELLDHAKVAASVFPFDPKVKAWKRVDPRTGKSAIDYTLNHQLWYAAALSELNDENHKKDIASFLTMLCDSGLKTGCDGRILHLLHSESLKGRLLKARYALTRIRNGNALEEKEIGYHLYNMHPLARLKRQFPDHAIFDSSQFKLACRYTESKEFSERLLNNKYSYPYNSPAFEAPLVYEVFGLAILLNNMFDVQIQKTYSEGGGGCGFYEGCPDAMTLNARMYEYFV